jgi:ribosomal-protein-alanine N-acetyltransferase
MVVETPAREKTLAHSPCLMNNGSRTQETPREGRTIMKRRPTLITERLALRPFVESDVSEVARLADDPVISRNTRLIPHPYEEAHAKAWIAAQKREHRSGAGTVFAVTIRGAGTLAGSVGLAINREYNNAELGYWIGREFWGRGYATEAARAVVDFGFSELSLNKIHAGHFADNPASGSVLEKIGMTNEGYLRKHVFRGETFRDLVLFGILRETWDRRRAGR